jgi:hypothetical protein
MHVHFFMGSMRTVTPLLLAANGVTTARSMSGSHEVASLSKEIDEVNYSCRASIRKES